MTKEVFGIPVSGADRTYKRSDQRPIEDLREIFLALINDENVVEFGWRQYTPYFNDGDTCEFGVGEPWIRTVLDDEDKDVYDLMVSDAHPTLGDHRYVSREKTDEEYNAEYAKALRPGGVRPYVSRHVWGRVDHEPQFPETYERVKALNAITHEEFEDTFLEAFGDHAEVIVRKDGITVDHYDHD